jgi:hypothetical protein
MRLRRQHKEAEATRLTPGREACILPLGMGVPPQYFQSIIAIELAVTGALLWQIRYFEHDSRAWDRGYRPLPHPLVRLIVAVILAGTLLGSLLGILRQAGRAVAIPVAIGLAISLLPILLRVLPPLTRSGETGRRDPRFVVTIGGLVAYVLIIAGFVILLSV